MAMRDERLMRCMRIVLLGVVSRSFAMMRRGLLMMDCRRIVMLRARKCFVHDILRYWMVMQAGQAGAQAGRRLAADHEFPAAVSRRSRRQEA
jgi:hypothetical protein